MLLEQEVPLLLRVGFLLVMVPVVAVTISLMIKYKKYGFGWILSHLILFSIGALYWIRILETRAFTSSAYNSLAIAGIGVLWGISMTFFVMGLLVLSDRIKQRPDK